MSLISCRRGGSDASPRRVGLNRAHWNHTCNTAFMKQVDPTLGSPTGWAPRPEDRGGAAVGGEV